jgi:DNA-binding NarL/FixJ family response regulator
MNRLKVLLVDEHERFRQSVASYLNEQGFIDIVGEAVNGEDAIAQTEQLRPDLVLLDPDIQQHNGFETTREIKLRAPGTIVVLLSMHGGEAYRKMAWRHSADEFIEKSSLKTALKQVLSQTRLLRAAV